MSATQTKNFKELVHPELTVGNWVPEVSPQTYLGSFLVSLVLRIAPVPAAPPAVSARSLTIPSLDGQFEIPAYLAQPKASGAGLLPGILWLHGGGMVLGSYTMDLDRLHKYAEPSPACLETGAVVLSPNYRLAPKVQGQTLVDDCFAAWKWMLDNADELKLDVSRIVVGGVSAGGGLAAALVQRIKHQGGVQPVFQLLLCPMLDDRTVLHHESGRIANQTHYPLWGPGSNRYGWTSYLGHEPALEKHSDLVPARRTDLAGLPPTWIGVGTLDLFHDEDVEYARRLREAAIDVCFEEVQGGWHGFDARVKNSQVSRAFWDSQVAAVRKALGQSARQSMSHL